MNLLVVIFVILMIWRIWKGFRSGLAKEMSKVVSLFMALIVLAVVFLLIASVWEKNIKTTIASVLLLLAVSIAYKLLNMIMKSIETLAGLPLIRIADRLLGAAAGGLELVIMFWIFCIIIESFPTGNFGSRMMALIKESKLLVDIYNKNYIANWIVGLRL